MYPEDYFEACKFIMKFGGFWVPDKKRSLIKWLLFVTYNYFCVIFAEFLFLPSELFKLTDTYHNLQQLMQHLGKIFVHIPAAVKVYTFYKCRKHIFNVLELLENPKLRYEEFGDFQPSQFFNDAKKLSRRVSYLFFILATLVPISSYLSILLKINIHFTDEDFLSGNVTCSQFARYYSWIPFSTNTKTSCNLGLVYRMVASLIYVSQIAGFDGLFSAILIYTKAHFQTVGKAFETIRWRCMKRLWLKNVHDSSPVLSQTMILEMKQCTQHLQLIIRTSAKLEKIFTLVNLVQVTATLFILVSCLFMLSTVPILSSAFAAQIVYLSAIVYELAVYCWFGSDITFVSSSLSYSLFKGDWISSNQEFKRYMIINSIRLQKPIVFTMGKFGPLTLGTFAAIIRGSYSYFAVLKNVNF